MQFPVIHVVKRFGRVGGMESYVWHLVHGLANRNVQVVVVCDQVFESPEADFRIVQVEASAERPRWKSMMTFRARVDSTITNEFRGREVLIHSHERSLSHHVTTFHGPPIESPMRMARLAMFSRRLRAWHQMERQEILGSNVQMILPVSSQVCGALLARYPEMADKKINLAWPGVISSSRVARKPDHKRTGELKFLFVGKEWKRKGLDIAVAIVKKLRESWPRLTLTIFGVNQSDLPNSMRSLAWVHVQGWSPTIPWSDFDLLLHPARKEPFGMVVAEARSFGVPVLMSSRVGARDLEFSEAEILDLSASLEEWCLAASKLIKTRTGTCESKWSWDDLVARHIDTIYPQVKLGVL
jgi:UDP-glucose:(heptosyl)LPS alpha-1,3-glucosyltransferase